MDLASSLQWYVGRAATESPFHPGPSTRRALRPMTLADARRALALGDHAEALAAFERAIASGEDVGVAQLGRALCLLHLGREGDAGAAVDAASDSLGVAEVPLRLARVCAMASRHGDALRLVAAALRAEPGLAPQVAADTRLATLRDHPAFLQMVGEL